MSRPESYAPGPVERTDPRVSPLLHPAVPGHSPAFVCTAGLDPLADEGIAYAAALAAAGTAVEHHHLPCHGHGLITSAGRIETGRRILDRVAAFIRETLAESV
ncbi:MAG: hypothetical protein EOO27_47155 [Comamonadaceae bacterium]|nr:MAG: hypothetical protein EOO27_47155 [Comamonadaceae bacterium]